MTTSPAAHRSARRWLLPAVTAAVALLIVAATFYLRPAQGNHQLSGLGSSVDLMERMQRIEQAQADQSRLLLALLQRQGGGASATSAPSRSGQSPSGNLGLETLIPVKPESMAQDLDARHRRDPLDPAWSARAEGELAAVAAGPGLAETGIVPRRTAMDCRSTLCRIEADFNKQGDAQDWSMFFLTMAGGTILKSQVVVLQQPDGSAQLRIYASRKPR